MAQTVPDARALIVTTPQEIYLADVRKSINFCRQVKMNILGLVENMSGLTCPHCGKSIDLFKTDGGRVTAEKEGLRLLANLPIEPEVVKSTDRGDLSFLDEDGRLFTREFKKMVDQIEEHAVKEAFQEKLDVIVFGHSHTPLCEWQEGTLFFNPGSVTDTIFAPYRSCGILEINDEVKGTIVRLS